MVREPIGVEGRTGLQPVLDGGYCVGCGACAAVSGGEYRMELTKIRTLEAVPSARTCGKDSVAARVCPFSNDSVNEDALAAQLFPAAAVHPELGRVQASFAAYVVEDGYREHGSSGGMGSWLLAALLKSGRADAVVHVAEPAHGQGNGLFGYRISRTVEEVRAGAKSRYYPVTLDEVVREVIRTPGRYAFSGVPCFIKAIRLMALEVPEFGRSVAYCMGLVCGHLKSRGFAEFLAWQMGVPPAGLQRFDFRVKIEGRTANQYGAAASGRVADQQVERVSPMADLYGRDWGMGLFKLKACDYCDDVVAETADITVGDAWLPRYVSDSGGTNLVIVRNTKLLDLVREAANVGALHLEPLSAADAVESQRAGFTHRRAGLAYRLFKADQQGVWRPRKRVAAAAPTDPVFAKRHDLRMQMAAESHAAFASACDQQDLRIFFRRVAPLAEAYRDLSRPAWKRIALRVRRFVRGDPLIRRALRNASKND